jgi:glycosyltransferase involved in cell wall biosynthesis
MTTTMFKRPKALSRTPKPATGGFDRIHNGLVSGWFTCTSCSRPPSPAADLLLNGEMLTVEKTSTPRPDVPGGLGFLLRFPPVEQLRPQIRIQCPLHSTQGLEIMPDQETWAKAALASIETSAWPMVTGWAAIVNNSRDLPLLEIDGYESITVRTTIRRPDVQYFLGSQGVGGFQVDLGAHLGYALPDATLISLTFGDQILATASISDSPLGEDKAACLLDKSFGSEPLDESTIHALRRRFRDTGLDTSGDWRDILDRLGQREYSSETEQWADYLTHHGQTPQQVAAWLALRATHALGVPALNPLPTDLDARMGPADDSLLERVRTWAEPILGVHDRPTEHDELSAPPAAQGPDLSDMKVAVAGLVHHKSGIGQNAQNSLKALELAGIHACAAPFFPAPGGWNARLGPSQAALDKFEDHAVLLHLPIDQVIPSLAAQPALLRTERLIGYFMWEMETVPTEFHRALSLVDEIWTATDFVADAFRRVTDTPVHVTGHAVDVSDIELVSRAELGVTEDAFIVHFSFDANSTVARKNPNAAIDAFQLAFGDDPTAVFILKVRNFQQVEWLAQQGDPHARGLVTRLVSNPSIQLITGEWTRARTLGLIQAADCYISLHRSEGFGYALVESISLGTPVVATGFSGITDQLNPDMAQLIEYDLTEVMPGDYFYWEPEMRWADPRVHQAADALRVIRAERDVHDRVVAVSSRVGDLMSPAMFQDRYRDGLRGDLCHVR